MCCLGQEIADIADHRDLELRISERAGHMVGRYHESRTQLPRSADDRREGD
jgi:hypothetical protein